MWNTGGCKISNCLKEQEWFSEPTIPTLNTECQERRQVAILTGMCMTWLKIKLTTYQSKGEHSRMLDHWALEDEVLLQPTSTFRTSIHIHFVGDFYCSWFFCQHGWTPPDSHYVCKAIVNEHLDWIDDWCAGLPGRMIYNYREGHILHLCWSDLVFLESREEFHKEQIFVIACLALLMRNTMCLLIPLNSSLPQQWPLLNTYTFHFQTIFSL